MFGYSGGHSAQGHIEGEAGCSDKSVPIWSGNLVFLSLESLKNVPCSAYRGAIHNRELLADARMWPTSLEFHQSHLQPLADWRTRLQAPEVQWYVRFVARGTTVHHVKNIDLVATTKRMAEMRAALEIVLPNGIGSLLLFADETVRGSIILIGVFLPAPPPRARYHRAPALHFNDSNGILGGLSMSAVPVSALRENPDLVWMGFLTVRGNSKLLCIEASATRAIVPDRQPLVNFDSWPRNLACTFRDIKPVPRTKIIIADPRAQWYVKITASNYGTNSAGDRKKMHQLCSVMINRELAFEIQLPDAQGKLYLRSHEELSGCYYLLGVFLPETPSYSFSDIYNDYASN